MTFFAGYLLGSAVTGCAAVAFGVAFWPRESEESE